MLPKNPATDPNEVSVWHFGQHHLLFLMAMISTLLALPAMASAPSIPDIHTAESEQHYDYQLFAKGITIPWGMTWLDDKRLLVTNRKGELHLIDDGRLVPTTISGLPEVHSRGQGGLLDIIKDPDYRNNGWLYFSYAGSEGKGAGANTSIMRARLDGLTLTNQQLLFDGTPNTRASKHYGSRLAFDRAGHLFFSIGDRGDRDKYPQDLNFDAGKIHRIHPDGSIPADNPFAQQANARSSIYSYGHRNPQGMATHPVTGDIWIHEHGPRGGDEINIIRPGANYGWPVVTYGINYIGTKITDETSRPGMQQPEWVWTPSIAPSGMVFMTSDRYPEWQGNLIAGSLKFNYLIMLALEGDRVVGHSKLFEGIGRVRSLTLGPDGYLYVGTDGSGIFKVVPKHNNQ
ncbi:MAG: PQQ-dependent sugar dehydrogenase [Candidatus Pelagadaptatus aseana]|uniref:PQQ-dependent sugar dehydrogenase n=1 Tax=Candidatus Pelagadaptatus aseana TaxID=3120508 RepID=UPI0039B28537